MIRLRDIYMPLIDSMANSKFRLAFYQYDKNNRLVKMSELYNFSLCFMYVMNVKIEFVDTYYLIEFHLKGD